MTQTNPKITRTQLFFVLVQTQVGIGVLSVAHDIQADAKSDAWISTLVSGLAVQLIILLLWALSRRYPQLNFYQIAPTVLGKFLGYGVNLLYVMYFLLPIFEVFLRYYAVLSRWFYPHTPKWILLGMLGVAGIYLAKQNFRIITRFFCVVTILHLLLILLLLTSLKESNILYLLPIGQAGIKEILLGSLSSVIAMSGFEIILFLFPLVQGSPKQILATITYANLYVTLLYTFIVFLCIIYFHKAAFPYILEPVLYMLNSFSFHLVQRVDLVFLSIWIVSAFTSLVMYTYLSALGLAEFRKDKKHAGIAPYIPVIPFLVALYLSQDPFLRAKLQTPYTFISLFMYLFFPALLLIISYLRKGKEQSLRKGKEQSL